MGANRIRGGKNRASKRAFLPPDVRTHNRYPAGHVLSSSPYASGINNTAIIADKGTFNYWTEGLTDTQRISDHDTCHCIHCKDKRVKLHKTCVCDLCNVQVSMRQSLADKQLLAVKSQQVETELRRERYLNKETGELVEVYNPVVTWRSDRTLLDRSKPGRFEGDAAQFKRVTAHTKRIKFETERPIEPGLDPLIMAVRSLKGNDTNIRLVVTGVILEGLEIELTGITPLRNTRRK